MAFGGFFGGSGGKGDKSSSSSSSENLSDSAPHTLDPLSTSFPGTQPASQSPSISTGGGGRLAPSETITRLKTHLSTTSNMANAKLLLSNIQSNCFESCIPNPSNSLTSSEQKCLSNCMEKFIETWNVTSKSYLGRLQREGGGIAGVIT